MAGYKIKAGDTLWDIARKNGTTVDALLKANPGINANALQIGQNLNLKSSNSSSSSSSSTAPKLTNEQRISQKQYLEGLVNQGRQAGNSGLVDWALNNAKEYGLDLNNAYRGKEYGLGESYLDAPSQDTLIDYVEGVGKTERDLQQSQLELMIKQINENLGTVLTPEQITERADNRFATLYNDVFSQLDARSREAQTGYQNNLDSLNMNVNNALSQLDQSAFEGRQQAAEDVSSRGLYYSSILDDRNQQIQNQKMGSEAQINQQRAMQITQMDREIANLTQTLAEQRQNLTAQKQAEYQAYIDHLTEQAENMKREYTQQRQGYEQQLAGLDQRQQLDTQKLLWSLYGQERQNAVADRNWNAQQDYNNKYLELMGKQNSGSYGGGGYYSSGGNSGTSYSTVIDGSSKTGNHTPGSFPNEFDDGDWSHMGENDVFKPITDGVKRDPLPKPSPPKTTPGAVGMVGNQTTQPPKTSVGRGIFENITNKFKNLLN